MLTKHLQLTSMTVDETISSNADMYKHEFTITYNPKFIYDIPYAESMTHHVILDVFKFMSRASCSKGSRKQGHWITYDDFFFNYCVEYQSNGYPHIHGTMFTRNPIVPSSLFNFENSMYRKYGKTQVYATGLIDRIHKNDHFNGSWQNYITKESATFSYYFHYDDDSNKYNDERVSFDIPSRIKVIDPFQ